MKKILVLLLIAMPLMASAQSTLTPQEQLEQAQKQLEAAQRALEAAQANAQKAQEEAQARAEAAARKRQEADSVALTQTAEIQKQIEAMQRETARLQSEAAKLNDTTSTTGTVETKVEESNAAVVENEAEADETAAPDKGIVTRLNGNNDEEYDKNATKYLRKNAVPVVDGKVAWTRVIKVPGKTAGQLYDRTAEYLAALTSDSKQLAGSQVAIKDKAKHNLVATVHEWLVFTDRALSLDRTEFFYVLNATCSNGQVSITMNRLRYKYDVQGDVSTYTAEEWITDKYAVNKKHTKLFPVSGKFRRKTIDRKDEIFETLKNALEK